MAKKNRKEGQPYIYLMKKIENIFVIDISSTSKTQDTFVIFLTRSEKDDPQKSFFKTRFLVGSVSVGDGIPLPFSNNFF